MILIGFAVLGPVALVGMSFAGVRGSRIEMPALYSGFLSIGCLCIWSAAYVREEPQRVRISLIWIAALVLFTIGQIIIHSFVH